MSQLKRYFLSGEAQFVSAFAGEAASLGWTRLYATRLHAVNVATGQVYYNSNANITDTTPASTTKMMTCYTLLQHKTYAELEQTVTIVAGDLLGGSGANLLSGDVISYRQLIANAILPSSNTSCKAISRAIGQGLLDIESGGVGDPHARFMAEMNTVSDAIGMTGSTWYNPAGLDGADYSPPTSTNITTPADMNIVMGLLWAYPVMAEVWIPGALNYSMPLTRSGSATSITISNVHSMYADAGVIGGKTGTTSVANACSLWQAPSGDVVAVTVFNAGSTGRYTESRNIITQLPLDFPELSYTATVGAVTSDVSAAYAIRSNVQKDLTPSFNVRGSAVSDAAPSYTIRASAALDLVPAFNVRGAVPVDVLVDYNLRGLMQADSANSYNLRGAVSNDVSLSYSIQNAGTVTNDLSPDYAIRGTSQNDLMPAFTVRGSGQSDVAASYVIRAAVLSSLSSSYAVAGTVTIMQSDLAASYSVFGVVGSGPTAADIAAQVIASLQATPIPVNMVQVKGQVISGAGSESDPWGP